MRARRIGLSSAVFFSAFCAAVGAAAQNGTTVGAQGELSAEGKAVVAPEDMAAEAEAVKVRGAALAGRLTQMLAEARKDKDILRVVCLNRKLTEVNATNRAIESRAKSLNDARENNDASRQKHEFTVISVLAQNLDMLDQKASQCLGQGTYEAGASGQVTTTVPKDAPTFDPGQLPPPPPPPPSVTVPPPYSPET
jgi:hypothetical protein